jgi:hypothetical protein
MTGSTGVARHGQGAQGFLMPVQTPQRRGDPRSEGALRTPAHLGIKSGAAAGNLSCDAEKTSSVRFSDDATMAFTSESSTAAAMVTVP